jgi:Tfp pilus assembly protein FimT
VIFEDRKENRSHRPRKGAGFTLMEILVVCFIISLTLVVSIPALRDTLLTDPLKTTARKIIGTVRSLREDAIREQQAYVLTFDLAEKRIRYQKEGDQNPEKAAGDDGNMGMELPSSVHIMDIWTKSDGKQNKGTITLWISPQGYMDKTVVHITDDSDTISILFSPFLGSIKVVDGYVDLE